MLFIKKGRNFKSRPLLRYCRTHHERHKQKARPIRTQLYA